MMVSVRIILAPLLAIVVMLPTAFTPAVGAHGKEIVLVVKIAGNPWFNRMAAGVDTAGKSLNVKAFAVGPSTADAAAQVSMIEDLVNRGVSAIAVVPTDAKALAPVFRKAREKKILVLTHESPLETSAVDYDIELIDSVAYARVAVDALVANIWQMDAYCSASACGFVMLVGGLTVPLHNHWADEALKYAKGEFPYLKELTSRLPTAESVDDSRKAVLDLSKTYPSKVRGIIGWGSPGSIGAAAAVREKGLKNRVAVGGSAIPSSAVPYLRDESMKWAQSWDPRDAGFAMVRVANELLSGKKPATGVSLSGLGAMNVTGKVISFNKIVLMRGAADAQKAGF